MVRYPDEVRLEERQRQAIPSLFFAAIQLTKPDPAAFAKAVGASLKTATNWGTGYKAPIREDAEAAVKFFASLGVKIDLEALTLTFDFEEARRAGANVRLPKQVGVGPKRWSPDAKAKKAEKRATRSHRAKAKPKK